LPVISSTHNRQVRGARRRLQRNDMIPKRTCSSHATCYSAADTNAPCWLTCCGAWSLTGACAVDLVLLLYGSAMQRFGLRRRFALLSQRCRHRSAKPVGL
jgi:hypothetical protein